MPEITNETPEMLFEMGKRFYLPSSGVADPLLALFYFNKSAEAGYVPAQRVLGTCYLEGRLIAPDFEKARQWLTEAARHKDAQAAYNLALMYVRGQGVAKDWDVAFQLLDMESTRHLADARQLKEQLKDELMRNFPDIREQLAELEKSRRNGYDSHRNRFIQPWSTPGRQQLEKDEFSVWLGLNVGSISKEEALAELTSLMGQYYDHEESLHPLAK
ncbi:hypothetical protein C4J81_01410 [Deltaproteobacteria bacterium Smac51]|nr:hypothetical protein C4J81_01410 [Deltaproteobacteria bacterium Smac51]